MITFKKSYELLNETNDLITQFLILQTKYTVSYRFFKMKNLYFSLLLLFLPILMYLIIGHKYLTVLIIKPYTYQISKLHLDANNSLFTTSVLSI